MPGKRMGALDRTVLLIKAVSDYQSGASIRDIAAKYDTTYKMVHTVLKESGIPMRPVGRNPYKTKD